MTKKLSYQNKLSWLRENKVVLKKEKVRDSTVNRLYSFYHKNPLSTPRNLAYGLPKRIEKSIQTGKEIKTPKGKISIKSYIKKLDKESRKDIKPPDNVTINYGHYYHYVKHLRDEFNYYPRPEIKITKVNIDSALGRIRKSVVPEIMDLIYRIYKQRKMFYKDYDIGARLHYKTFNFTTSDGTENPVGYTTVAWTPIHELAFFKEGLLEAFEKTTQILYSVSASEKSIVVIYRIDIHLSTKSKPTDTDKLRL